MSNANQITLYLDLVSPFAYLAFYFIRTSPVFKDCEVKYVPVFLGGIMKATGNRPPLAVKNKNIWIARERIRWARLFSIPMAEEMPEGFPQNTLFAQRTLCAVALWSPENLEQIIAALYRVSFVERKTIHTPEALQPVLADIVGEAGASNLLSKLSLKSTSDEAKKLLSSYTEEALEEGIFGVPYYVVTNSKGEKAQFWGFDHIGQVAYHLNLKRPVPPNEGGWRAML